MLLALVASFQLFKEDSDVGFFLCMDLSFENVIKIQQNLTSGYGSKMIPLLRKGSFSHDDSSNSRIGMSIDGETIYNWHD